MQGWTLVKSEVRQRDSVVMTPVVVTEWLSEWLVDRGPDQEPLRTSVVTAEPPGDEPPAELVAAVVVR